MRALDKELSSGMKRREAKLRDGISRLVYLQPNRFSDEALTVAVVLETSDGLYLDKVGSPDNYRALECLFGAQMREQTLSALEVLREYVHSGSLSLAEAEAPTDLLEFGPVLRMSCDNPEKYARDLLRVSSSLYRTCRMGLEDGPSVNQKQVVEFLRQSIIRLNPFRGRTLVKPIKVQLKNKTYFEIPICGELMIGSPISMATKEVGGAKTQAEALIARLHYAREQLHNKTPVVLVFTPTVEKSADTDRIQDTLAELELVGRASEVDICPEDSIEKLARAVFKYENIPFTDPA